MSILVVVLVVFLVGAMEDLQLACCAAFAAFIGGIAVLNAITWWRVSRRAEYQALARAEYESDLAAWERQMDVWQHAYYCHRDDWVFAPGAPSHPGCPADSLRTLLTDSRLQDLPKRA